MSSPNFPIYETERIMAEGFYDYYPHIKKINKAIWSFFQREDYLWLSEINKIAKKLKIDTAVLLVYLQLLANQDSENPPLLRQNFYQLSEDGQLVFVRLSLSKVTDEFKTNPSKEAEQAFIDWAKSVFTCWEVVNDQPELVLLPDASFNFATNSLWDILQNW